MTLLLNPVLQREMRARWRKWPTFAILFGYACFLAVALGWRYLNVAATATVPLEGASKSSAVGYLIFKSMAYVQTAAWILLAPVLTAPAIAAEREQGLLELLQLSPLTPRQILGGKLLSVLWFVGLMLLVPLPIIALCFQLGGVAPEELLLVTAIQASTAFLGVAVGLWCSARCARVGTAIQLSLGIMVGGCIGVMLSGLTFINPLYSLMTYLEMGSLAFGDTYLQWLLTPVVHCLLAGLLLRSAALTLLRPLPEETVFAYPEGQPNYGAPPPPSTPLVHPSSHVNVKARPSPRPYPGAHWLLNYIPGDNPILRHELRVLLSRRQGPVGCLLAFMGPLLAALAFATAINLVTILAQIDSHYAIGLWWFLAFSWLLGLVVASSMMSAAAFTRDRERGMLDPILHSLLTPAQILFPKLAALLIVYFYYSAALLPALLLCVRSVATLGQHAPGIAITQALGTAAVLSCAAVALTIFGMLISWYCKRTVTATLWTVGLIFLAMVSALILPDSGGIPFLQMGYWHPFVALSDVAGALTSRQIVDATVDYTLTTGLLSLGGIALLHRLLRSGGRERDRHLQRRPQAP